MVRIRRQTFRRFVYVVSRFFASGVKWKARGLLAAIVLLLLGLSGLNVLSSYAGRDFMTALAERRADDFRVAAVFYLSVFVALTTAISLQRFAEERLGLLFRGWLTGGLVAEYLKNRAYLRLRHVPDVDNPDERIAEDAKAFAATTLSFFVLGLNGVVTVVAFAGVAWAISPSLFAACVAYAAAASAGVILLGRRLPGLNSRQLDREAEFRASLIHVREEATGIALAGAERPLRNRLVGKLRAALDNIRSIVALNRTLNLFTNGFNYLTPVVPILVVGPRYLRGEIEFGVVTQSAVVFAQLVGAFALLVTQFQAVSSFTAVVSRLDALAGALENPPAAAPGGIEVAAAPDRLAVSGLTLRPAEGDGILLNDFSAAVGPGQTLAVVGPNGAGREALFLAAAGLWEHGSGRVERPPGAATQFVTQTPYLLPGSLRDQFQGDDPTAVKDAGRIQAALDAAGLGDLAERVGGLDAERDWPHALPFESRQRLALARVLFARPKVAVLDRVDTALGDAAGELLDRLRTAGIAWVALSDGDGRAGRPDAVYTVHPDGSWTTTPRPARVAG